MLSESLRVRPCSRLCLLGQGGRGDDVVVYFLFLFFTLISYILYLLLTCLVLVVFLFLFLSRSHSCQFRSFPFRRVARRVSIYPFTIQWMILPHYVAYCCVAYIRYTWSIAQWYKHGIMGLPPPRGLASLGYHIIRLNIPRISCVPPLYSCVGEVLIPRTCLHGGRDLRGRRSLT